MLCQLVEQIRMFDKDIPIIIAVNGENGKPFDEAYRVNMLKLCADHPGTFPIFFTEFRSLSKLWNTLVIHAPTEWVYVLNDDCQLKSAKVLPAIRDHIETVTDGLFYAPRGWSHFVISKSCLDELGYFDERLLGVGEEDGDMLWRYEGLYGRSPKELKVQGLGNRYDYERGTDGVEKAYGNKTRLNTLWMFGDKYQRAETGRRGMFSFPVVQRLPNESQYPYERFYRDRRHMLGDTTLYQASHEFNTEWVGDMKPWGT